MNQDELNEYEARLRAEANIGGATLPPRVRGTTPAPGAKVETFVEKLRSTAAYTALEAQLVDEAARLVGKLVTMEPQVYKTATGTTVQSREDFQMQVEALRGEIRGMLRVLDAPAVAQRAIEQRRSDR